MRGIPHLFVRSCKNSKDSRSHPAQLRSGRTGRSQNETRAAIKMAAPHASAQDAATATGAIPGSYETPMTLPSRPTMTSVEPRTITNHPRGGAGSATIERRHFGEVAPYTIMTNAMTPVDGRLTRGCDSPHHPRSGGNMQNGGAQDPP